MLYLAQVDIDKNALGLSSFLLIAVQESEEVWGLADAGGKGSKLQSDRPFDHLPGAWVIVKTNDRKEILQVDDAKPWIISLIQSYLTFGVTPEFLRKETERAEQWRQSLTLQSQELDRRALELEARREQLQALEADLKQERQDLEDPNPSSELP
jgi:hypothetical protein